MDTVFKISPLALAVCAISTPTLAEQQPEVVEIVGQKMAGIDAVISSDDLDKHQASDLQDVFRKTPEVTVGGSAGITQKLYVRGLEDTMLNVTIDGAQQTSSLFHHQGRISIEPELIKQVEVAAGAGRATNGPGALGGAIQFKTKDAHDLLHNGNQFGAKVKAGYYYNTSGYKGSVSLFGEVSDGLGLLASYTYVDQENLEDGRGEEQPYTAAEQQVGLIKLSGDINEKHYISLGYDFRIDNGTRLNKPHFVPSFKNEPLEQEADRETLTANYVFSHSDYIKLDATLYNTKNRIAHLNNPRFGTSDGNIETFGAKLFNTAQLGQHTLVIGVDYIDDQSEFSTQWDGDKTDYEKGKIYGFFLQNDWQVSQALLITAGARYDSYELTDNINQNFDSSGFSPNVGIDYQFENGLSLFASYAEAFRGQTAKELFLIDYAKNDPDRKPETAKNAEIGAKFQGDNLYAGVTLFDSEIKDVVGKDGTFTNIGKFENQGITAYIGAYYGELSGQLSYSQSRPELNGDPLTDGHMNLGTSIGDTWVLDINYSVMQGLEFGWTGTFVERLEDVYDVTQYPEKPGYGVHDIYAQWQPVPNEELLLTLSVKNLFDKYYFDHGTYIEYVGSPVAQGYAAAGRDFRFNLSYAF
ncbi:TonB-dependent receptor domain-containing protein [Vibrio intestinalis]|uniref:TonB-dependent receptor domain-containing protein n=1 Tax=Vibrio intestinalis TaxID=2933291 RepID=UPI0021A77CF6|nr:TonB-dependent receptor [Vibrio intestinalis]